VVVRLYIIEEPRSRVEAPDVLNRGVVKDGAVRVPKTLPSWSK
jgi:hypothetical protein